MSVTDEHRITRIYCINRFGKAQPETSPRNRYQKGCPISRAFCAREVGPCAVIRQGCREGTNENWGYDSRPM
jgi:hypothetical protein